MMATKISVNVAMCIAPSVHWEYQTEQQKTSCSLLAY